MRNLPARRPANAPRGRFAALEQARKEAVEEVWAKEFAPKGHCMLCGNHGVVDTRGKVQTPAGVQCGGVAYCICPNGRRMKEAAGAR
jgi:hypothetical protein